MIAKGKTQTGFEFEIDTAKLDNYDLVEYLADMEENPLVVPKIVRLILGDKQAKSLKEHCREKDGRVPVEKVGSELTSILTHESLKN